MAGADFHGRRLADDDIPADEVRAARHCAEGLTLLVSRPKLGKSWLVLDLAIATAGSRFTLGELKPSPGDVLYLALEDGRRRLQRRMTKLLPTFNGKWPEPLDIITEWPRADQGGLAEIEQWITSKANPRLVIVDTLAQFRRVSTGKTPLYMDDYAAISDLQKLASKYNIAIVVVHHDRKSEADDVFDTISGSLGLTGAADTLLVVKRQAGSVTLHVRGRDIEEAEKAIQFNKNTCRWTILGEAAEVNRSSERARVLDALANGPLAVSEIKSAADLKSRDAADKLLQRMAKDGDIQRVERGKYGLTPHPLSEVSESPKQPQAIDDTRVNYTSDTSDTTFRGRPIENIPAPPPEFLGPPGDSADDFLPDGL